MKIAFDSVFGRAVHRLATERSAEHQPSVLVHQGRAGAHAQAQVSGPDYGLVVDTAVEQMTPEEAAATCIAVPLAALPMQGWETSAVCLDGRWRRLSVPVPERLLPPPPTGPSVVERLPSVTSATRAVRLNARTLLALAEALGGSGSGAECAVTLLVNGSHQPVGLLGVAGVGVIDPLPRGGLGPGPVEVYAWRRDAALALWQT